MINGTKIWYKGHTGPEAAEMSLNNPEIRIRIFKLLAYLEVNGFQINV